MGKYWFISAPLFGHLDWGGFLKTAKALQTQGHNVVWISQRQIGGYLVEQGIPFQPIERTGWLWPPPPPPDLSTLSPQEAVFIRYQRALDTWLSEELIPGAVEDILALADRIGPPDVLVTDPFLSAAAIASEKIGTKMAVCGWPATEELDADHLLPVQRDLAIISRERIAHLCQQFGVQGDNFTTGSTPFVQSPHLHISYFNNYWYQSDPDFLPQTHFVGGIPTSPTAPPPEWLEDLPPHPAVLITLGSVFTNNPGFFAGAAQAVYQLGRIPIVVIGRAGISPEAKAELKEALPPMTRLLNWVDFDHLMPRLEAIVHHGGMGTTHAAVIHGLPQVIVPHAADQRGQARRASQAKVGLSLTVHDVRNGQLFPAIRAVVSDEYVQRQCRELAEEFRKLGGPSRAAELLVEIKN